MVDENGLLVATREEIERGVENGDKDILNLVASGQFKVADTAPVVEENAQPVATDAATVADDDTGTPTEVAPQKSVYDDEIEQERRYRELVEERAREEKEALLREKAEAKRLADEERKAREGLERQLQELEAQRREQSVKSSPESLSEEEEEYASEYSRQTRRMIDDLKNNSSESKIQEIVNRLIQQEREEYRKQEDERSRKLDEQRKQQEATDKLFKEIDSFQQKYDDLRTSKPVKQLNDEVVRFKSDLAYVMQIDPRDEAAVNRAISKYLSDDSERQKVESKGVRIPQDYDKFQRLQELLDFKNGIEVDKYTGQIRPIVDEFGNRVRYRSLEEAAWIKNGANEINNARREAYKEVASKIESRQQGAVTLDNKATIANETTMTAAEAMKIIDMDSPAFRRDPANLEALRRAYERAGLGLPKSR